MIPKRMYFFWSSDVMSWMRYMTLYSFRKMNPDWEIVLCLSQKNSCTKVWSTPENQDFLCYRGNNYFDRLSELDITIEFVSFPNTFSAVIVSPVHESDLYRYYKLYNNGGFYSDMDILYFRSMDNIYSEITQCGANTILHTCPTNASIGFLGSEKDNLFYKDLLASSLNVKCVSEYQSYGVSLIYNFCNIIHYQSNNIKNIINNMYNGVIVFIIPNCLVYQYDSENIEYAFSNCLSIKDFGLQSIGYHWYGGHFISQRFNNLLNENNYMDYRITFSEIAKEILR